MTNKAKSLGSEPINYVVTLNNYTGKPDGFMCGLTKREYFAAMTMSRLAEYDIMSEKQSLKGHCDTIAKLSCMYADSLLEELSKTE